MSKRTASNAKAVRRRPFPAGLAGSALLLALAWTGAPGDVRADTIVLKSGEVLEGSIIDATRNTVIVRPAIGGMRQMSIRDIREVRIDLAQGQSISGQLLSWADGVYQVRSGDEVVQISGGDVLSRAPGEAAGEEPQRDPPPRPVGSQTVRMAAAPATAARDETAAARPASAPQQTAALGRERENRGPSAGEEPGPAAEEEPSLAEGAAQGGAAGGEPRPAEVTKPMPAAGGNARPAASEAQAPASAEQMRAALDEQSAAADGARNLPERGNRGPAAGEDQSQAAEGAQRAAAEGDRDLAESDDQSPAAAEEPSRAEAGDESPAAERQQSLAAAGEEGRAAEEEQSLAAISKEQSQAAIGPAAGEQRGLAIKASADPAEPGAANMVFKIELSQPAEQTVVLIYGTVEGTAKAGEDFEPRQGVVTLSPGTESAEVLVPLIEQAAAEGEKRFELFLAADPKVAEVVDKRVIATIGGGD